MLGLVIGAASGAVQFWMLLKFVNAVTGGILNTKAVLLGVFQFFLPLVVLLSCALLFPGSLLPAASGMAGALIICAVTRFLITIRSNRSFPSGEKRCSPFYKRAKKDR